MTQSKISQYSSLFSPEILELIILPTEQCNFRCEYCYESFHPGRLSPELVQSIKLLIDSRVPGLHILRIGWFGGEPLLARKQILEIALHAKQVAMDHPNLAYESGMSTNGYLLSVKTASELVNAGITEYQISLDGTSDYHDSVRVKRNQTGTFKQIWQNLSNLRKSDLDFKINLRVHLSKDNLRSVRKLTVDIGNQFDGDNRFCVFFKPLVPLGGVNDSSLNCLGPEEASSIIKDFKSTLNGSVATVMDSGSPYVCYAARPTSFIIRTDGRLAKCTIGLDDPENQIGLLNKNGTLSLNQHKIRPWLQGAVSLDSETLRCPRRSLYY